MKIRRIECVIIGLLVLCICAASVSAFVRHLQRFDNFAAVSDYNQFLRNRRPTSVLPDEPVFPFVEGFTLTHTADVSGIKQVLLLPDYLYFMDGEEQHFIADGTYYGIQSGVDLLGKTVRYNKFTFINEGKMGLKDIFGTVIIPPYYDSIIFSMRTAVAIRIQHSASYSYVTHSFVYYDGVYKGSTVKTIFLHSVEGFVVSGSLDFFDVSKVDFCFNSPLTVTDFMGGLYVETEYRLLSPPDENGMFMIRDEFERVGFANANGILIKPEFVSANYFEDSFAMAWSRSSAYHLEYRDGAIIRTNLTALGLGAARITAFVDGYAVFYNGAGIFGVLDYMYRVVVSGFSNPFYRVLGRGERRFILDLDHNIFYSVGVDSLFMPLTESFCAVYILGDYFAARRQGVFYLLDIELNKVAMQVCEYEHIHRFSAVHYFAGNRVLVIGFNDKLFFFKAN